MAVLVLLAGGQVEEVQVLDFVAKRCLGNVDVRRLTTWE